MPFTTDKSHFTTSIFYIILIIFSLNICSVSVIMLFTVTYVTIYFYIFTVRYCHNGDTISPYTYLRDFSGPFVFYVTLCGSLINGGNLNEYNRFDYTYRIYYRRFRTRI